MQSMSDLLKRRKNLTEPEVRYYLVQLISSLKYLHSNLVIHRDLKLGNLFLDSQMRIKVGDFGLATKIADVNERRKTFCGTPNYIGKTFVKLVKMQSLQHLHLYCSCQVSIRLLSNRI
jgi:serine/threonine protein kinase